VRRDWLGRRRRRDGNEPPGDQIADLRLRLAAHALADYARQCGAAPRFLLWADMRDLVFQRDPALWLAANLPADKDVLLSCEPGRYDHEWNRANFIDAYGRKVYERVKQEPVINSGLIAGRFAAVVDLLLAVYLVNSIRQVTDQAALNLLMSFRPWRERTLIKAWHEPWALHAGMLVPDGDTSRAAPEAGPIRIEDGVALAPGGSAYTVLHQYDRIAAWADPVAARYRGS
jgi:hypothetical protein